MCSCARARVCVYVCVCVWLKVLAPQVLEEVKETPWNGKNDGQENSS